MYPEWFVERLYIRPVVPIGSKSMHPSADLERILLRKVERE